MYHNCRLTNHIENRKSIYFFWFSMEYSKQYFILMKKEYYILFLAAMWIGGHWNTRFGVLPSVRPSVRSFIKALTSHFLFTIFMTTTCIAKACIIIFLKTSNSLWTRDIKYWWKCLKTDKIYAAGGRGHKYGVIFIKLFYLFYNLVFYWTLLNFYIKFTVNQSN